MARQPRPLQRHLSQAQGPLATLLQRISSQQAALQKVSALLPDDLRTHCLHADFRQRELLLLFDSPAWANRARYLAPTLLEELRRRESPALKRLRIQVTPQQSRAPLSRLRPRPRLSASGAEALRNASTAVADQALAAALQRLARHGTDSTE